MKRISCPRVPSSELGMWLTLLLVEVFLLAMLIAVQDSIQKTLDRAILGFLMKT